jgi:hypothetical protein
MSKLYEELKNFTFDEFDCDDISEAEEKIKYYVSQGKKLNVNNINKIFYDDNCVYIYKLLIEYGYVFKNNLYLIQFLSLLNITLPKDYKTYKYATIRNELVSILDHPEVQRILNLSEIKLTDKDIDKAIKLFKNDRMNEIGDIINYYNCECKKNDNQIALPKLNIKLEKYKFEKRKIHKII